MTNSSKRSRKLKRMILIGMIVALVSQLYWNVFVINFRISTSVIALPVLLMTLGKNLSTTATCSVTAVIVFIFRLAVAAHGGVGLVSSIENVFPNAVFYFCYGIIFNAVVQGKHTVSFSRLFPAVFFADFGSNLVELCISESSLHTMTPDKAGYLLLIALFRTFLTGLILMAESHYRALLKSEEHENRYRRLFLMTTGLKNEIYFMRKNSEEIESVMANAYKLYEKLNEMDVPEDMKHMSLAIARDVHEIKKDYIRIIQGIEEEISDEYDEKRMSFQDLLKILEDTTYHMLENKNVHIQLEFQCSDNFMTEEHYELMAILKNLVNNAIEAIESDRRFGMIYIEEHLTDGNYVFRVTDDGPGISPRHLPNIFKMGYSTKFDQKTGNIFRGVGLYGVKMTVEEQFKGSIDVESEQGIGTTFTITIPATSLVEETL